MQDLPEGEDSTPDCTTSHGIIITERRRLLEVPCAFIMPHPSVCVSVSVCPSVSLSVTDS